MTVDTWERVRKSRGVVVLRRGERKGGLYWRVVKVNRKKGENSGRLKTEGQLEGKSEQRIGKRCNEGGDGTVGRGVEKKTKNYEKEKEMDE